MKDDEPKTRLGVVIDGEASLVGRKDDPVEFVIVRSTFLNPPRAAAAKRLAARIRGRHPDAEVIPYAWHYLSHEASDGIEVGQNRSLDLGPEGSGHLRGPGAEQAWVVTKICAEAFDASHVIFRTPPSFSPGALSRRRLTAFVQSCADDPFGLVWEPMGVWTLAEASAFAGPLGVEIMGQALAMSGQLLDFGGAQWLRVSGGKQGRLRASQAEMLAIELADAGLEQLSIAFEGPRAYANLREFHRALALV